MGRGGWTTAALALALFAGNLAVNRPLLGNGAQPYRGSIENGYAGIAGFVAQNPNPWGWNPNIYCGISTQHTYLPGMPYAVASLLWLKPELEPLHAYRIVVAVFAALGPVTLFLLASFGGGSRWWALLAAIAYSLCSPAYDLFQTVDKDRGLLPIPWRLHVMVKYGEGPHIMGLTLLPLALLAVMAARRGGFRRLLLAALGLAAVALTHWIAALALAICCLLLMATGREGLWRIVGAGVLAYALACFWLTPEFIRTVAFNWPKDSFNYRLASQQRMALVLIGAGVLALLVVFRRFPRYRYLALTTLCFFVFGAFAEGHYAHAIDPIPEARRYTVEMELFLVLAVAEWMRVGWVAGGGVNRFCVLLTAALLVAQGVPQAMRFVRSGYAEWQLRPKEETIEYQTARRLMELVPQGRVHVSGGVRFGLNSWFDLAQTNGTFESGLTNRNPLNLDYRFRTLQGVEPEEEREQTLRALQALGVEYVAVHGSESQEHYRDVQRLDRFAGLLDAVHEAGPDRIYRVPFRSLAHYVQPGDLPPAADPRVMGSYTAALGDGRRARLEFRQVAPGRVRITGPPPPEGAQVHVMVSFDAGWRAAQAGQRLRLMPDATGYFDLRPLPGVPLEVELRYGPTAERMAGAAVSVLAALWCGWRLVTARKMGIAGNRAARPGI